MQLIQHLNWRYATKHFDPSRHVSKADIEHLKDAIRLSASSFGLQPYKVLIVENQEIRQQLLPATLGQKQVLDASHVFVLCNYTDVGPDFIDEYIQLVASVRGIDPALLQEYGGFMKMVVGSKSPEQLSAWLERQPYLALGNLLAACAELRIDACPMEGFDAAAYNRILGLDEKGLNACVICAVGYRSPEDYTQNFAKVRWPHDSFFEEI